MAKHALFITGTDTGVGKTTVACGLAAALRRRGLSIGVFKPAETGCEADSAGQLVAGDAALLRFFSESPADPDTCCPYRFVEPLAPAVAAQRERKSIQPSVLRDAYEALASNNDVVLVEGAGGLLVPFTESLVGADLAHLLRLPVLLVVGNRLGCVNHALLTVDCVRMRGLRLAGYVMNAPGSEVDLATQTNARTLEHWLGPPLGSVPFLGPVKPDPNERARFAAIFEEAFDLDEILAAAAPLA